MDKIDTPDNYGNTPLMIAAARGNLYVVKSILDSGANPHIKDRDGMTARVRAENRGHTEVADVLEKAEKTFQQQNDSEPSESNNVNDSAKGSPLPNKLETKDSTPILSVMFYTLAVLSFIGGIIFALVFWPGDPGYGRDWKSESYMLSMIWFMAGVIEAALFSAIGQGLSFLHRIVENTSATNTGRVEGRIISYGESKKCPYCAESIKRQAIICRYCGQNLPEEEQAIEENTHPPKRILPDSELSSAMKELDGR